LAGPAPPAFGAVRKPIKLCLLSCVCVFGCALSLLPDFRAFLSRLDKVTPANRPKKNKTFNNGGPGRRSRCKTGLGPRPRNHINKKVFRS